MSVKYDKIMKYGMKYGMKYNVYILRRNDRIEIVNDSYNIWF